MEDNTKAYIFPYYIREISGEKLTKAIIAKDVKEAKKEWGTWRLGVAYSIEEAGEPELVKD